MALLEVFKNQKFTPTLTCKDADGDVINLTDRTVHFYYRNPSGTETIDTSPTTSDAAGEVTHEFAANALDEAGVWLCKAFIDTDEVPSTRYAFRVKNFWEA